MGLVLLLNLHEKQTPCTHSAASSRRKQIQPDCFQVPKNYGACPFRTLFRGPPMAGCLKAVWLYFWFGFPDIFGRNRHHQNPSTSTELVLQLNSHEQPAPCRPILSWCLARSLVQVWLGLARSMVQVGFWFGSGLVRCGSGVVQLGSALVQVLFRFG